MDKPWFPQRNEKDATVALTKSLMFHLGFPISKLTIEKDIESHKEYPLFSDAAIIEIFGKWGIEMQSGIVKPEFIGELPPLSFLFIEETERKIKSGQFIMLFSIQNNSVEYLHPRKGWVIEEQNEFMKKWSGAGIFIAEITGNGEQDFEIKEKDYNEKKHANPELKNIRIVDDFLKDSECEYIINLANPLFQRSKFLYGDKAVLDEGRTSYSAEFHIFPDDPVLLNITKRASELLNIPVSHFEPFQCLAYNKSQEVQHHYDTFDANSDGGQKIIEEGGQRKITMLAYLNEEFEGGGTYFPDLDYLVIPKKRRVLIFNNLDENDQLLKKAAWHGGLPVTTGTKYAMNMWIRNKPCK
jgi:prolyl 4-hydroxylase